jgi:hypothetical protein
MPERPCQPKECQECSPIGLLGSAICTSASCMKDMTTVFCQLSANPPQQCDQHAVGDQPMGLTHSSVDLAPGAVRLPTLVVALTEIVSNFPGYVKGVMVPHKRQVVVLPAWYRPSKQPVQRVASLLKVPVLVPYPAKHTAHATNSHVLCVEDMRQRDEMSQRVCA